MLKMWLNKLKEVGNAYKNSLILPLLKQTDQTKNFQLTTPPDYTVKHVSVTYDLQDLHVSIM